MRQALKRYRKAVYGKDETSTIEPVLNYSTDKIMIATTKEKIPLKQSETSEPYLVGQSLRQAIDKVKATRPSDDMCEDVITGDKAQYMQAAGAGKLASQDAQHNQETITEDDEVKNDNYEKSSFVKNMRLKASETDALSTTDKASEKQQTPKNRQDKKLNQEISRHEFRMPENYRIIVR